MRGHLAFQRWPLFQTVPERQGNERSCLRWKTEKRKNAKGTPLSQGVPSPSVLCETAENQEPYSIRVNFQAQAQSCRLISGGQLTQAVLMRGSMAAAKAVYSTEPPEMHGYGGNP